MHHPPEMDHSLKKAVLIKSPMWQGKRSLPWSVSLKWPDSLSADVLLLREKRLALLGEDFTQFSYIWRCARARLGAVGLLMPLFYCTPCSHHDLMSLLWLWEVRRRNIFRSDAEEMPNFWQVLQRWIKVSEWRTLSGETIKKCVTFLCGNSSCTRVSIAFTYKVIVSYRLRNWFRAASSCTVYIYTH